jgi:phosphoribosylglycinamide formyltransferase-1
MQEAFMKKKIRVGALISGGGTNLQAILDASRTGAIDADVVFVGTDNPAAKGLERARRHGIRDFVVDYPAVLRACRQDPGNVKPPADFRLEDVRAKQAIYPPSADRKTVDAFLASRAAAEALLLKAMPPEAFDLLVLAGFMRNLTPYFIDRVNTDRARPRIMNIHPALLPAFPGTDGYGDTVRYGCKVAGCTVHFVDYGEDSGPIIGQRAFAVREDDTLDTVRQRGLELEWQLYPECIQLFARGRLQTERVRYERSGGAAFERTVVRIRPEAPVAHR